MAMYYYQAPRLGPSRGCNVKNVHVGKKLHVGKELDVGKKLHVGKELHVGKKLHLGKLLSEPRNPFTEDSVDH